MACDVAVLGATAVISSIGPRLREKYKLIILAQSIVSVIVHGAGRPSRTNSGALNRPRTAVQGIATC